MHKSTATHLFIESYYGDTDQLHIALRQDYLAVQFAWECFTDSLCKDGNITTEQYNSWVFPWRY